MTIKLYVGITCIPGREEYLEKTLTSFSQQKYLPNKVFISYCTKYTRFPDKNFDKSIIDKFKNDNLFFCLLYVVVNIALKLVSLLKKSFKL